MFFVFFCGAAYAFPAPSLSLILLLFFCLDHCLCLFLAPFFSTLNLLPLPTSLLLPHLFFPLAAAAAAVEERAAPGSDRIAASANAPAISQVHYISTQWPCPPAPRGPPCKLRRPGQTQCDSAATALIYSHHRTDFPLPRLPSAA